MHETLRDLYAVFLHLLETNLDLAQPDKAELIHSGPFHAALSAAQLDEITPLPYENLPTLLKQHVESLAFPTYGRFFLGAVCAAAAAHVLTKGANEIALTLAERAIDQNRLDLFPQDTILEANHRLNPAFRGPEEIQEWLKTRFCLYPFNWVEIVVDEKIYSCCTTFLPTPLCSFEDVARDGVAAVRNSPAAQKIRDSIMDGSFKYCSKMHCTAITNKWLMSREEGLAHLAQERKWPEHLMLAYDRSCNLSCPSCRTEPYACPKSGQGTFDMLKEKLIDPLLPDVSNLYVTGSGDPFASSHFRRLLTEYCHRTSPPIRKLILETNGVLCDDRAWREMGLYGHVKDVLVSIDAATEPTFNILRRGGDWKRLIKNMRFLGKLRREGEIPHLLQRYVVQVTNFREMPDFVRMGLDFAVDSVEFTLIRNWNTFTPEEFARHNIGSRDHPDYAEFLEILKDPIFDHPVVNLSGMRNLQPQKPKSVPDPGTITAQELVLRLYKGFAETLMATLSMAQEGQIVNSEPFADAVDGLAAALLPCGGVTNVTSILRKTCEAIGLTSHSDLFIGAVCAAAARQAWRRACPTPAQELAEEAVGLNPRDLFARLMLEAATPWEEAA